MLKILLYRAMCSRFQLLKWLKTFVVIYRQVVKFNLNYRKHLPIAFICELLEVK